MIKSVIPKLPYIDIDKTKDYYLNKLEFKLVNEYPDYLILQKDGIELHFFPFPSLEPRRSDFMIYLRIDEGIETFYENLQEKGVAIHPNGKLTNQPWNQKEFSLLDPNGTLLTFGQAN
jgi:catechol 2,3-dioxygenase-like lactoylglutathione lyase family enzyme